MKTKKATAFSDLLNAHLLGKAASGLERIMCGVLVKRTRGKHG